MNSDNDNNATTPTPNFDNLLLRSLMSRLQIGPTNPPFLANQPIQDLLFCDLPSDDEEPVRDEKSSRFRALLAQEEAKLEKELIKVIMTGETESLKANSGQAITIGDHHICVGFHDDKESEFRVWEWHGHIMMFDEENGYTPEYIYGNYFQRSLFLPIRRRKQEEEVKEEEEEEVEEEEKEEKVGNLGLRELIESGESNSEGRILRRNNVNAGSPRV